MGFLSGFFGATVIPGGPPSAGAWWLDLGGDETESGQVVDEKKTLSLSAIISALRVLTETPATLPLNVHERRSDGRGSDIRRDHPVHFLVHEEPNEEMAADTWRQAILLQTLLRGMGYSEIERDNGGFGDPVALHLISTLRVTPKRHDRTRRIFFEVASTVPGQPPKIVQPANMLAVPSFTMNGIVGMGLLDYAEESIGLSLAAEKFTARQTGNKGVPLGFLKHPGRVKAGSTREDANRKILEEFAKGRDDDTGIAVLNGEISFEKVGLTSREAQILQTRRFQVGEVARFLRVPPTLLMDLSEATFNNQEGLARDFLRFSQHTWLVRLEKEFTRKLFRREDERARFFIKHNVRGLLRTNTKEQTESYAVGLQNGFYSQNDVREFEDMNPVPGGDVYRTPLNMSDGANASKAFMGLMVATVDRCLGREAHALRRAIAEHKTLSKLKSWHDDFRIDQRGFARVALHPMVESWSRLVGYCEPEELSADLATMLQSASDGIFLAALGSGKLAEESERWTVRAELLANQLMQEMEARLERKDNRRQQNDVAAEH